MNKPFFTVVIPTYNRSTLLKRAVDSVLKQTFNNFEIIIVDDHSTDNTSIVVGAISDPRIRYLLNKRTKGACGARNTGIFSAKANWIAFLDDDDVWFPEKLHWQYDLINNAGPLVGLVCTDYAITKENRQRPKIIKNRPSGWMKEKLLYGWIIGCLSSTCIRSDILLKIKGFDEKFSSKQDQDLWLRVANISKFEHVPLTLVYMYQGDRKDRIGQNLIKKLEGNIMLREKYSKMINRSLRLRHRYESNIFIYAFTLKKKKITLRCLPWFLLGIIVDFPQFLFTMRNALLLIYRTRTQYRLLPWV